MRSSPHQRVVRLVAITVVVLLSGCMTATPGTSSSQNSAPRSARHVVVDVRRDTPDGPSVAVDVGIYWNSTAAERKAQGQSRNPDQDGSTQHGPAVFEVPAAVQAIQIQTLGGHGCTHEATPLVPLTAPWTNLTLFVHSERASVEGWLSFPPNLLSSSATWKGIQIHLPTNAALRQAYLDRLQGGFVALYANATFSDPEWLPGFAVGDATPAWRAPAGTQPGPGIETFYMLSAEDLRGIANATRERDPIAVAYTTDQVFDTHPANVHVRATLGFKGAASWGVAVDYWPSSPYACPPLGP